MRVWELEDWLSEVEYAGLEIQIATSDRKLEWYRIVDLSIEENHEGETVVVINTD